MQLLEQYQGVSYGNKVFGNVLLFPLMKRHDVKYRKTLWSEYMGVVETFTVQNDEVITFLKYFFGVVLSMLLLFQVWLNPDGLLYPIDTDYSLFACYSKALAMKTVPENSIMYQVAFTNVRQYNKAVESSKTN